MNLFLTHQDFILQAQGELVGSGMSLHTHTHGQEWDSADASVSHGS